MPVVRTDGPKNLPKKITFGYFARRDKNYNYWNVFCQNRQIHLKRCKPQQPVKSASRHN